MRTSLCSRVSTFGKNSRTCGSAFIAANGARSASHHRRSSKRLVVNSGPNPAILRSATTHPGPHALPFRAAIGATATFRHGNRGAAARDEVVDVGDVLRILVDFKPPAGTLRCWP